MASRIGRIKQQTPLLRGRCYCAFFIARKARAFAFIFARFLRCFFATRRPFLFTESPMN